jgi:hypothetical protein
MAESQSKKKVFTMVGGICSLVAAAMAVVFAIYCLVYMFKDFGNNNPGWAIFELVLAVLIVALAAVAVLGGLKLLAGSNLPASSNDTFRAVFFFFAIVFAAICLTEGLAWTIQGINNQVDVGGWIARLIVGLIFLVGCVVLMVISKSKAGLLGSILFFVGIGCFMIGHWYVFAYDGSNFSGGWAVWLLDVALLGVEAMGVLARVFEDKLGK